MHPMQSVRARLPRAAIRAKVYEPLELGHAPATFKSTPYRGREFYGNGIGIGNTNGDGQMYTLQVAPEDCTGCHLCITVCPAKDKSAPKHKAINMQPQRPIRAKEAEKFRFFLDLPEIDLSDLKKVDARTSQLLKPLFECSGACAGCGETPYIKLLTQLFGDRALIANATGCSSIYGGNLPTTPFTTNQNGRGPAWANSLFEDNAEFGFGFRLSVDALQRNARTLLRRIAPAVSTELVTQLLDADQSDRSGIRQQRERVEMLREQLKALDTPESHKLELIADSLVKKSVWLVAGDGWAYDIGYGGLDHVLAQKRDINVLVLDTEVYSNTGGQQSKATPLGAMAKFASAGREIAQKDLGMAAMIYGHVYVARVAMGARVNQVVNAFVEADSYPGPSLIIAHGYDLRHGADQQTLAVKSGVWPLYRFDPRRVKQGRPPLRLDSGKPSVSVEEYMQDEARFHVVQKTNPERFKRLLSAAECGTKQRYSVYQQLASVLIPRVSDIQSEERQP